MLSICIVNYNSADDLLKCLESFEGKLPENSEVLIFDNDSRIPLEILRNFAFPFRVFNSRKNIGFARAQNILIKKAVHDCVLVLNPDTEMIADVTRVVRFFKRKKKMGVLTTKVIDSRGRRHSNYRGELTIFNALLSRTFLKYFYHRTFKNYIFPSEDSFFWITGSTMFIKKSLLEPLGWFDPGFFLYCEDVDLCYKARASGLELGLFPDVKFMHRYNRSSEKIFSRAFFHHVKSFFYFLWKWKLKKAKNHLFPK